MKTKCERAGSLLILIGMLMLTVCAALLFYNARESKQAENGASQRLSAVKAFLGSSSVQDHSGKPDTQTVPAPDGSYSLPEQPELPAVELDGEQYIGILNIPAVGLELPVMRNVTKQNLKQAPCWYSGSLQTADLVICAHNYQSSFGKLRNLNSGDTVLFTAMDGKQYAFHIAESEVLMPDDISGMTAGNYPLSLYTCTYNGTRRFTVRCAADHPEDFPKQEQTTGESDS